MKRLLTLTICTLLLLCSCGGNSATTPVTTPETEETTLSAPETTAETTAVTTTAKVTTTTTTEITTAESIPENICYQCSLSVKSEEVNGKKLYSIEGLADSEMAAQVDKFINESAAELAVYEDKIKSQGINETNLDFVVSCNVINGYLSVKCGYYNPDYFAMFVENFWYEYRTAVFDIVEGRRIESFGELFFDGFDYEDAFYEYIGKANNSAEYDFTAYSIISAETDRNNYFTYDVKTERLFSDFMSLNTLVLTKRNFEEYVTVPCETVELPLFYTELETDTERDGFGFVKVLGSRFLSDEEVAEKSEVYENLQKAMYEHYCKNREKANKVFFPEHAFMDITEYALNGETLYTVLLGNYVDGIILTYEADGSLVYMRDIFPEFADSEAVVSRIFDRNDGSTEVWYSSDEFTYDCHKKEIAK
ncbi:MAG: hypothetical protein ACI4J7_10920 [Ruminiclostridium sp.]